MARVICSSTQKSCTSDLAVELFKVSAFLFFFLIEFDVISTTDWDLSTKLWIIIAKNFAKSMNLKIWRIYKQGALNFSCIISHLIYYNLRGIYLFKVNNNYAGWEMSNLYAIISGYVFTLSCLKIFLWQHILQWNW